MQAADMPPRAHIIHAVGGRTRLILPARRGDAGFFAALAESLRDQTDVESVATTPRAGSVVIRHRGPFAPVSAAAELAGLFAITDPPPPTRPAGRPRRVPALSLAVGGLAGLGAIQVARGQVAGNAVELLWNGYQAHARLGLPMLARALAGIGLIQLARGRALGSATSLLFYALSARQLARGRREAG
jgi:hypothetical protein